jgi:AI-2 transport protein TqsA
MNNKFLNSLLIFSIVTLLLYLAKSLLLPLVFGFLLFSIMGSWGEYFQKFSFFGKKIPYVIKSVFSTTTYVLIIALIVNLTSNDLQKFKQSLPLYEEQIQKYSLILVDKTGFNIEENESILLESINLSSTIKGITSTSSSVVRTLFTMFLYFAFILVEKKFFIKKLKAVSLDNFDFHKKLLKNISNSIQHYISIKTITSLFTAVCSYLVLYFVGLEFAFLFAFFIFIFNFIPSIGSLISTMFPVLFSILQFGDWKQPLIILILVGIIQLVIGNVIEPNYMGEKLKISPLLVIFSVFFWGFLWGVPGMFLAVPLTIIIMIVLSNIPATKNIGIWMSKDGKI